MHSKCQTHTHTHTHTRCNQLNSSNMGTRICLTLRSDDMQPLCLDPVDGIEGAYRVSKDLSQRFAMLLWQQIGQNYLERTRFAETVRGVHLHLRWLLPRLACDKPLTTAKLRCQAAPLPLIRAPRFHLWPNPAVHSAVALLPIQQCNTNRPFSLTNRCSIRALSRGWPALSVAVVALHR